MCDRNFMLEDFRSLKHKLGIYMTCSDLQIMQNLSWFCDKPDNMCRRISSTRWETLVRIEYGFTRLQDTRNRSRPMFKWTAQQFELLPWEFGVFSFLLFFFVNFNSIELNQFSFSTDLICFLHLRKTNNVLNCGLKLGFIVFFFQTHFHYIIPRIFST